jgi:hypothetical protein
LGDRAVWHPVGFIRPEMLSRLGAPVAVANDDSGLGRGWWGRPWSGRQAPKGGPKAVQRGLAGGGG